jgi:hypothetical protein
MQAMLQMKKAVEVSASWLARGFPQTGTQAESE